MCRIHGLLDDDFMVNKHLDHNKVQYNYAVVDDNNHDDDDDDDDDNRHDR